MEDALDIEFVTRNMRVIRARNDNFRAGAMAALVLLRTGNRNDDETVAALRQFVEGAAELRDAAAGILLALGVHSDADIERLFAAAVDVDFQEVSHP